MDQSPAYEKDLRNLASCVTSRSYLLKKLNTSNEDTPLISSVIVEEGQIEVSDLSNRPTTPIPEKEAEEELNNDFKPEAKGDNIPPSESSPELKKNEQVSKSSALRNKSERVLLTEKPILDPKGHLSDNSSQNIVYIEDLLENKTVVRKKIIKVIQPIKSDQPEPTTLSLIHI